MHKFINEIKKFEGKPFVISNFLNKDEVGSFRKLYDNLPIEINNKRQNIVKKKWSIEFNKELQNIYNAKLKTIIGNFSNDI